MYCMFTWRMFQEVLHKLFIQHWTTEEVHDTDDVFGMRTEFKVLVVDCMSDRGESGRGAV